jgi:hypothetical protein
MAKHFDDKCIPTWVEEIIDYFSKYLSKTFL